MQQAISYRDKNGFVILKDRTVCRFVAYSYAKEYDHFMQSGLYQRLVDAELLISHKEDILSETEKLAYYKILLPELITCISFPYEWSASQWKDVILSFLQINSMAMECGMILKDATPFNFTFYKGKCIFIDTISFDFYKDGEPWLAYRQFCETMLGPLALIHFNNVNWTRLMSASINGWELPFISRNLPRKTWFNTTTLLHIHWHSKYSNAKQQRLLKKSSFTKQKLLVLWDMLYRSINKWKSAGELHNWSTYYDTGIESASYLEDKTAMVRQWLCNAMPDRVVDLGANNGKFSLIASLYAKEVVAVESDHACIDQLYLNIQEKKIDNITTILSDITQPTPGVGWNNKERMPLLNRLNCDMVLALALIHHLCISKNIPLAFVAHLLASITGKYALVEFVPKSDPKIQQLLANREDIFDDYSEEQFIIYFNQYFELQEVHSCFTSERKLFLWVKK